MNSPGSSKPVHFAALNISSSEKGSNFDDSRPQCATELPASKTTLQETASVGNTERKSDHEFVPPDGGWGWVVCFASFWINGIIFGMLNTFGIMLPSIQKELGGNDPNVNLKISLITSISLFTTFFMSMIASITADQFGIRKVGFIGGGLAFLGVLLSSFVKSLELMYLTYGILFGLGSAFVYSGSLVILGHYFKKKMTLVNGIVTAGSAVFTIVLPFLQKYLLEKKGLSFTLQIEGGLIATTMLCTLAFKPILKQSNRTATKYIESKQKDRPSQSGKPIQKVISKAGGRFKGCLAFVKRYLNVDIWKNRGYVIWSSGMAFSLLGYFIPLVHINNYIQRTLNRDAEVLVMIIGGVSGLGKLISGKLGDIPCINRIRLQQTSLILFGLITIFLPFVKQSFEGVIVFSVLLGLMDGCFLCLLGPITFDLVGPSNASQGVGFLLALMSVPLMIGPLIGGWIFDETGSYDYAFYYAGVPPLVGASAMLFIPRVSEKTSSCKCFCGRVEPALGTL